MKTFVAVLLALAPSFQDDGLEKITIGKQQRSLYQGALNAVREAAALIDSDPAAALTRIAPVFANADISHREVRLRLEDSFGGYGEWTVFLPYQVRGRASLAQAKKIAATARAEAGKLAKEAVDDLKFSVERKAASSAAALDEAQKLVESLKETAPVEDPRVVAARKIIEELRALVDGGGAPDEVIQRCDATAEQVKGTPSETEHALLRKEAVRRKADAELVRQETRMRELREWLKTSPTPADVIARCDQLAPDISDVSLSRELKTIRDGAATDRILGLRLRIATACDEGRFRDAVEILAADGGFLSGSERAALRSGISAKLSGRVGADVERVRRWLRSTLTAGSAWTGLRRVPDSDLPALFSFPDPAQIVESKGAVDWCASLRILLEKCRATADASAHELAGPLLASAVEALPFPDLGLEAFAAAAALARDATDLRIEAQVAFGLDGLEADRLAASKALGELRQPYEAALVAVNRPGAAVDPLRKDAVSILQAHRQAILDAPRRIPVEDTAFRDGIAKYFNPSAADGVFGNSPLAALEASDRLCKEFLESSGPRTLEQRRLARAVTFHNAAMRLLLQGESVERLAEREDLRNLARAGGDLQRADFSMIVNPKIRRLGRLLQE